MVVDVLQPPEPQEHVLFSYGNFHLFTVSVMMSWANGNEYIKKKLNPIFIYLVFFWASSWGRDLSQMTNTRVSSGFLIQMQPKANDQLAVSMNQSPADPEIHL